MPRLQRTTRRLVVRPIEPRDFAAWRAAFGGLKSKRNRWDLEPRQPEHLTRAYFRKLLSSQARKRKNDSFYDLLVFRRADGALVGGVSLMEVARSVSQTCFLGYWVLAPYWGNGYAKEAVAAALDIGFKDVKLHRIEAGIEPGNDRSIRLAKSLKMRYEGRKKRCLYLRGRWIDLLIYTLTCEDLGLKFRGPTPTLKSRV